jgi:intein-encoded DNA endonuclease-like protein
MKTFSQNYNITVDTRISPEAVANADSRFVSTFVDNTVRVSRTTNNLIFSCLDPHISTLQQARDTTKQIFHLNSNAATKTFEQNTRELTRVTHDASIV